MIMNKVSGTLALSLFVSSCSLIDTKHAPADLKNDLIVNKPLLARPAPSSYLRFISQKEILNRVRVTYSNTAGSLLEILTATLPQYNAVPLDPGVDMTAPLAVSVSDLSLLQFLEYLEGLTGYSVELTHKTIKLASRKTKEWNLAALASLREHKARVGQTISSVTKGTEGKEDVTSTTTQFDNSSQKSFNDQWDLLLRSARAIIGAPEKENITPPFPTLAGDSTITPFGSPAAYSVTTPPFVVGNRSMGILLASGEPRRVKILDQYLKNLVRTSTTEVNIDVKAFDVTMNDDRGSGIDWEALRKNTKWGFDIATPNFIGVPGASAPTGLWSSIIKYTNKSGNSTVTAAVRFLENYGKVQLVNEPNVTAINGTTAYLSSGDEFSFVSDIEQRQDGTNAGTIVVTPKFSRIRVGVTMAVTPRLLEDDRILLDIVPVVSSLQGFTKFKVTKPEFEFNTPNIALQELSTQVITRSGETVQLGGLIYRKIEESLTRIPIRNNVITKLLDLAFKSNTNKLKRRELVLLVTPTLVEGAKWSP